MSPFWRVSSNKPNSSIIRTAVACVWFRIRIKGVEDSPPRFVCCVSLFLSIKTLSLSTSPRFWTSVVNIGRSRPVKIPASTSCGTRRFQYSRSRFLNPAGGASDPDATIDSLDHFTVFLVPLSSFSRKSFGLGPSFSVFLFSQASDVGSIPIARSKSHR